MVYNWNKAFWKLKLDSGLISFEQYRSGLEIRDYVPMRRVMDYAGDGSGASGPKEIPKAMASDQVDRFMGGSMRDSINPLEAMIADAYETRIAIAQNDMVKALDRLAMTTGDHVGAIVERIPAHDMHLHLETDPIEDLATAAKQAGHGAQEIQAFRDMLETTAIAGQKVQHFRPKVTTEKGNVLFFRDGGTLRAIRIADGKMGDQVISTFQHMQKNERDIFVSLLAAPAKVLRVGVTGDPAL